MAWFDGVKNFFLGSDFEAGRAARAAADKHVANVMETAAANSAKAAETASVKSAEKFAAQAAKAAEKQAGKTAKQALKAIENPGFRHRVGRDGLVGALGGTAKKGGKVALIGGAVIAGAAALGVVASKTRKNRQSASRDEAMLDPMGGLPPAMPTAEMMPQPQQTMMGMEPVEGERAQAVKDQRESGVDSPQVGA